jgi:hypothetical protein
MTICSSRLCAPTATTPSRSSRSTPRSVGRCGESTGRASSKRARALVGMPLSTAAVSSRPPGALVKGSSGSTCRGVAAHRFAVSRSGCRRSCVGLVAAGTPCHGGECYQATTTSSPRAFPPRKRIGFEIRRALDVRRHSRTRPPDVRPPGRGLTKSLALLACSAPPSRPARSCRAQALRPAAALARLRRSRPGRR